MVTPLVKPKIVKKKTNKFKRHQSDLFIRVPVAQADCIDYVPPKLHFGLN